MTDAKTRVLDTNGEEITKFDNNRLKSDLQQDLDDSNYSKWYPIAKIGATYRF